MATLTPQQRRARRVLTLLTDLYPSPKTALHYENPVQLLVAVILSAQCTDARVNLVTPALFARFPDAASLAAADRDELEQLVRSTGFYRNKASHIQECCRILVEQHGGKVPASLDELVKLPGIGRKTANVVLGEAFGTPGITVDTHFGRLSRRIGLTTHRDPVKVEHDLMALIPRRHWTTFSHLLILHGRGICHARKPKCSECVLNAFCPRIGVPTS
jgi:endonuclease-3